MGYRLSKIYTRTGDQGTTGLGDGTRVKKDHPRVESYGAVDELNSLLGFLATRSLPEEIREIILEIQHDLFDLGGELCIPGHEMIRSDRVDFLEARLDVLNGELQPLAEFLLPGGTEAAAVSHMARTVCRRAERRLISLQEVESVSEVSVRYLNRLSDLLFVIGRVLNKRAGESDLLWDRSRFEPPG